MYIVGWVKLHIGVRDAMKQITRRASSHTLTSAMLIGNDAPAYNPAIITNIPAAVPTNGFIFILYMSKPTIIPARSTAAVGRIEFMLDLSNPAAKV